MNEPEPVTPPAGEPSSAAPDPELPETLATPDENAPSEAQSTRSVEARAAAGDDATVESPGEEAEPPQTRPARKKRPARPPREWKQVLQAFTACGRCSFFLAGYKVLHGQEALSAAALALDGDTIILVDDPETRRLLYKSYGWRVEAPELAFRAVCPECRRAFAAGDEQTTSLEIAVRPKARGWK